MRILLVTPRAKSFGGVSRMDGYLECVLNKLGHSVDYLTADECKKTLATKIFGEPWWTAKQYRKINEQYDLVIANGEFGFGLNCRKSIVVFHGCYYGLGKSLWPYYSVKNKLSNYWRHQIQKMAAKKKIVITVGDYNKSILEDGNIVVDYVINNPVDLTHFNNTRRADGNGRALFIGANNYYAKGIDLLEKVSEIGIKIDCISNSSPSSNLNYLGEVDYNDLPKIIGEYDFLIHPSRFEASSMVVLEAMSCGIPVLISETGAASNIKKDIPEFVIDFENSSAQSLLDRIEILKKERTVLGNMARSFVEENHSHKNFEKQWDNVLKGIL